LFTFCYNTENGESKYFAFAKRVAPATDYEIKRKQVLSKAFTEILLVRKTFLCLCQYLVLVVLALSNKRWAPPLHYVELDWSRWH